MNELENMIARLDAIAKKNGDEFKYRLDLELTKSGRLAFTFVCSGAADDHEFLSASGRTIEEVVAEAYAGRLEACEAWGYKV